MATNDNFSSNYDIALSELDRISGNILLNSSSRKVERYTTASSSSSSSQFGSSSANKAASTYERIISPLASTETTPLRPSSSPSSSPSPVLLSPSKGWSASQIGGGTSFSVRRSSSSSSGGGIGSPPGTADRRVQRELYRQSPQRTVSSLMMPSSSSSSSSSSFHLGVRSPEGESSLLQREMLETQQQQSPTSVGIITAFRDLQSRARMIEQDRAAAVEERDQLKHVLLERKRNEAMWRSRIDIESTEQLLEQRARGQLLRSAQDDTEAQIQVREDIFRSLQKGLFAQTQREEGLEREIVSIREGICSLEVSDGAKMESIRTAELKCEELAYQIKMLKDSALGNFASTTITNGSSGSSSESQQFQGTESMNSMKYLQVTAVQLEKQLLKERKAQVRLDVRCRALQKYMELILKINEDLTQMLMQKARAQAEILDIAEGFSSRQRSNMLKSGGGGAGQHYTASPERVIPTYDEILHVIREEKAQSRSRSRSPSRQKLSAGRAQSRSQSPSSTKLGLKRATSLDRVFETTAADGDYSLSGSSNSSSVVPRGKADKGRGRGGGSNGDKKKAQSSSKLLYNVQNAHIAHDISGRVPVDRNRVSHSTLKSNSRVVAYSARASRGGGGSQQATRQKVSYPVHNSHPHHHQPASYLKPTVTTLYSQHRSVWEDPDHPQDRSGAVLTQPNCFIPSSLHPSKIELNSIAQESKVNKAVRELNATIASRVKSVYKQF